MKTNIQTPIDKPSLSACHVQQSDVENKETTKKGLQKPNSICPGRAQNLFLKIKYGTMWHMANKAQVPTLHNTMTKKHFLVLKFRFYHLWFLVLTEEGILG